MSLIKDMVNDNKKILLLSLGLLAMSVVGVFVMQQGLVGVGDDFVNNQTYSSPEDALLEGVDYKAVISTIYGDIEVDLYENEAPNAVNSFVFLAGEDFYDGLKFHKVIKDFVIQAGDQTGDGDGDPGYELEPDTNNLAMEEYSMAMANASQFFIVVKGADVSELSDYTVMGKVISGFSVVDAIEKVSVDGYTPVNDVTINSVLIEED